MHPERKKRDGSHVITIFLKSFSASQEAMLPRKKLVGSKDEVDRTIPVYTIQFG